MATDAELVSLYRYFAWADYMRRLFDESLQSADALPGVGDPRTFVTMSYWYGALYVVVEAWQERFKDVSDATIDALLNNEERIDLLRRYRNATFHYHPEYYHDKFLNLMREGPPARDWILNLHNAFQAYLDNWFESSGSLEKAQANARELQEMRAREETTNTAPKTGSPGDWKLVNQYARDDLIFLKRQQWRVSYYGLLLYAALVASANTVKCSHYWPRMMAVLVGLAFCGAMVVNANLHGKIDSTRKRGEKAVKHFPLEIKKALTGDDGGMPNHLVSALMYFTIAVGAIISWCLIVQR